MIPSRHSVLSTFVTYGRLNPIDTCTCTSSDLLFSQRQYLEKRAHHEGLTGDMATGSILY